MAMTGAGARPHYVTLENPLPGVPDPTLMDGDGGYLRHYRACSPPDLWVKIESATSWNLTRAGHSARITASTVLSTITHLLTGPFHPQVTTQTRVHFSGRLLDVVSKIDADEAGIEMSLACVEVVL